MFWNYKLESGRPFIFIKTTSSKKWHKSLRGQRYSHQRIAKIQKYKKVLVLILYYRSHWFSNVCILHRERVDYLRTITYGNSWHANIKLISIYLKYLNTLFEVRVNGSTMSNLWRRESNCCFSSALASENFGKLLCSWDILWSNKNICNDVCEKRER